MTQYRRINIPGATRYFTVNLVRSTGPVLTFQHFWFDYQHGKTIETRAPRALCTISHRRGDRRKNINWPQGYFRGFGSCASASIGWFMPTARWPTTITCWLRLWMTTLVGGCVNWTESIRHDSTELVGNLFQGRYKANLVKKVGYLLEPGLHPKWF